MGHFPFQWANCHLTATIIFEIFQAQPIISHNISDSLHWWCYHSPVSLTLIWIWHQCHNQHLWCRTEMSFYIMLKTELDRNPAVFNMLHPTGRVVFSFLIHRLRASCIVLLVSWVIKDLFQNSKCGHFCYVPGIEVSEYLVCLTAAECHVLCVQVHGTITPYSLCN